MESKQCSKCGQIKNISEFGNEWHCKDCLSIYRRRKRIKSNTPEENLDFLYKLFMRGESIYNLSIYFECDVDVIEDELIHLGIYSKDPTLKYCSRCETLKSINVFTSKSRAFKHWCGDCVLEYNEHYYQKNSEVIKKNSLENYYNNHEAGIEYRQNYYYENKEDFREYKQRNRGAMRANDARYRAAKLQATPPWVDLKEIRKIYEEADKLTRETGVQSSVDHIHPLQGKISCGLHVPWNLQIITLAENCSKGNKLLFG